MNGTLCFRAETPVAGAQPDLFVRHKYYYGRHGVQKFLGELHSCDAFVLCVYTSMMAHNVHAGLDAIVPGYNRLFSKVLDRSMNKPDPDAKEPWDTVRDMDKVWAAMPSFGPQNTILLDNEAQRFRDASRNGIVVPEFGPREVELGRSETLQELQAYLLQLARDQPPDVREYMTEYPFEVGLGILG